MTEPTPRPRYATFDIVRGGALIAMVIYHVFWDLAFLRFFPVDVSSDLAWVIFARSILSVFLLLVGAGLVLSHGSATRWPAFWRRFAILAGAAAIITIATLVVFPQSFVYFGILHAIALFSFLALPFLRMPIWLAAVLALVVMAFGWGYSDPFYNERLWSWIGFWTVPPLTNDLVPIFPWFGLVLAGIVLTRLMLASPLAARAAASRPTHPLAQILTMLGRWTLLIYLLHQPVLLGVLYPLSLVVKPSQQALETGFLGACQANCTAAGTQARLCTTYCQCGLTGVKDNDLWAAVNSGAPTGTDRAALDTITRACSALIYPVAPQSIPRSGP